MGLVELRRLYSEWRIRLRRVQEVIQPTVWSEQDWNRFAHSLVIVINKYGNTWDQEETKFSDIRWDVEGDAQLICQTEISPSKRSLVVAQQGGFADSNHNYTWFYAEFNEQGEFIGNPYWVDGNWKDALAMVLLPQQMAAGFYLQASYNDGLKQNLLLQDAKSEGENKWLEKSYEEVTQS
ncbi:MAG: hypothetical protein AAGA18_07970 [Verrucomicrobiota bacterium]